MIRGAKALVSAAVLMFVGGSVAAVAATGATGAGNGAGQAGGSNQCEVRVDRSGAAGSFDLTRQVLQNGQCICYVKTGSEGQGGSPESMLRELLGSKDCSNAPPAVKQVGSNFIGPLGLPLLIAGGAGATAAGAAAAGGSDSP